LNRSKTKSKTKEIAWLLLTVNWKPLYKFKPGFHMIVRIVRIVQIVPVVSKNVQTIGTIIWKHYPDDRNDSDRFKIYTIVPTVRIELNSIQAIEVVSVVRNSGSFAIIWVAFPYDRPDRLNIFYETTGTIRTIIWKPGFTDLYSATSLLKQITKQRTLLIGARRNENFES